ncbi:NAD(P)/FAD-dependent oxidoreductase [Cohnella sp.]|uniref:NAD(P)/FAD-dependent oxidoreductase n=1 Tax=Cohnella sp. TaxID=1883426 RepID=UPI00370388FE
METMTCVVVGGGYAGINTVKALLKASPAEAVGRPLRIVLMDKNAYHLRKVLLFRAAAGEEDITIPLSEMFPKGVELLQAEATGIESAEKRLRYKDARGAEGEIEYDWLVLATGSVVRRPKPEQGGIALSGLNDAKRIREAWQSNLLQAAASNDRAEQEKRMTIAVAGAGISGIETAAELAYYVRADAERLGLDAGKVRIVLYNSEKRLFPTASAKVGRKLENALTAKGITVRHSVKVLREEAGRLTLADGRSEHAGLCIWTLGLLPNPRLRELGVPVTSDGHIGVDGSYRVSGLPGVYAIGDNARIVDPATGRIDGKTCKEAIGQAPRLIKIMAADAAGRPAPVHKSYLDLFCFGLGPEQGLVWTRQWGLDIVVTGKLGWKIRKMTWDMASLIK